MNLVRIFIFFCFAAQAWAQDERSLIKILSEFNRQSLNHSVNLCLDESLEELSQQCARALCGPPEKSLLSKLTEKNFELYVKPEAIKELHQLEPYVSILVELAHKNNQKFLESIRRRVAADGLKFENWEASSYSHWGRRFFDDHLDISLDLSKPLSERLTVKPIFPNGSSLSFQRGLSAYAAKTKEEMQLLDSKAMDSGIYTKKEASKIFQNRWKSFLSGYAQAVKKDPSLKDLMKGSIDELKRSYKQYVDSGSEVISIGMFSLEQLEMRLKHKVYVAPVKIERCGDLDCQKAIQEIFSKEEILGKIEQVEKRNDHAKMLRDQILACKSRLASLSLKKIDPEGFRKVIPQVIDLVLAQVTKGYSEESKKKLGEFFNKISFEFGEQQIFVETPTTLVNTLAREITKHKNMSSTDMEMDSDTALQYLFKYENQETGKIDPLAHLFGCGLTSIVGDSYNSRNQKLTLSHFSLTNVAKGKEILAHELGHAIRDAFGKNKLSEHSLGEYRKMRACVTANAGETNRSSITTKYFPGDENTTEEDMADLISFMTFENTTEAESCYELEVSEDRSQYVDLDLKNKNAHDIHSSGFMRVLLKGIHRNKPLPESCQKVIKAHPQYPFRRCF